MSMKAQDFMDQHNDRADMVNEIIKFCADRGYSYTFTEKKFIIKLAPVEPLPVQNQIHTRHNQAPNWTLEPEMNVDELPPVEGTLNEGETPPETEPKG